MTNANELEIALLKANVTKRDFAKMLGISVQTLYNKLSNKVEFKAGEIEKACKVLRLNARQREKIFCQ